jgi:hypothetical protein
LDVSAFLLLDAVLPRRDFVTERNGVESLNFSLTSLRGVVTLVGMPS